MTEEGKITIKEYKKPDVKLSEIRRYLGCIGGTETAGNENRKELDRLISDCLKLTETAGGLSYFTASRRYRLSFTEDGLLDLGFCRTGSKNLQKNLEGCSEIVLFCATVGRQIDLLTSRYRQASPSKAVCLQAIGAERVESLCDAFCNELKDEEERKGRTTRPRFSPGYGDLTLLLQKDIFSALELNKTLGVFLNDSLLMLPSKTVTAIVGIKPSKTHQK